MPAIHRAHADKAETNTFAGGFVVAGGGAEKDQWQGACGRGLDEATTADANGHDRAPERVSDIVRAYRAGRRMQEETHIASTSAREGNAVCVPRRVTATAATWAAVWAASRIGMPSLQKTASAAVNASPAPVGSTAYTGTAGI